jgi:hypothetical protein
MVLDMWPLLRDVHALLGSSLLASSLLASSLFFSLGLSLLGHASDIKHVVAPACKQPFDTKCTLPEPTQAAASNYRDDDHSTND